MEASLHAYSAVLFAAYVSCLSRAVWPATGGDTGGIVDNDWLTVRAMLHLRVHVRHVPTNLHAQSTRCNLADIESSKPGGHVIS